MSNLTKFPLEDWFETTLAQSWDWQLGAINVNATPNFTFPAGVTTYVVVEPWKINMQVAEINAYNAWLKQLTASNIVLEKWAWINSTSQLHPVGSKVIISDNYQFWADIQTVINSKLDNNWGNSTTTWDLQVWGSNFRIRFDGWDMKFTDNNNAEVSLSTLTAGAWVDTKVAVSVGDTTPWQLENKLTAWDGLSITKVNPLGNESLDLDIDLNDASIFSTSWASNRAVTTDWSGNLFQATTSKIGWVERLTDAEALAWTDTTRYLTSKQAKDNYALKASIITLDLVFVDSAQSNINIAHWLGKIPRYINATIGRAATAYNNDIQAWSASYDWTTIVQKTHEDNWSESYDDVLFFYTNSNSNYWSWRIVSIDTTNITLAYTDVWTAPSDTIKVKIDFIG